MLTMRYIVLLPFILLPGLVHAQGLFDLAYQVGNIVGLIIPIVFGLAIIFFFWGLAKFLANVGNEDAVQEGKNIMIWGVITLFIMASVWGIIQFFQRDILGGDASSSIDYIRK